MNGKFTLPGVACARLEFAIYSTLGVISPTRIGSLLRYLKSTYSMHKFKHFPKIQETGETDLNWTILQQPMTKCNPRVIGTKA